MKTIAKNRTAKISEIIQSSTCRVYTETNHFNGADCDPWKALEALMKFSFAKLRENNDGSYTVRVHGNWWYELSMDRQARDDMHEYSLSGPTGGKSKLFK